MRRGTDKLSMHKLIQSKKRKLEDVCTDDTVPRISFTSMEWKRCAEGFDTQEKKETEQQKKNSIPPSRAFHIGNSFGYLTYPREAINPTQNSVEDILWDSSDSGDELGNKHTRESVHTGTNYHKHKLPKPELHKHKASKVNVKTVKHVKVRKCASRWRKETADEDITVPSSDSDLDQPSVDVLSPVNCSSSPELIEFNESEACMGTSVKPEEDCNSEKLSPISTYSPVILSCQSSQSTNSISASTGLKASDWIKTVQWQTTPVKTNVIGDDSAADVDSAKKKKLKFNKGGFAEQLFHLQNREKSSIRMWSHEQDETFSQTNSSRVLFVRVEKFELLFSLQLAVCLITDGGGEESPVAAEKWQNVLVLFSRRLMDQLEIEVGTTLRIHPPWQQLDGVLGKHSILLCTHYAKLVTEPVSTREQAEDFTTTTRPATQICTHYAKLVAEPVSTWEQAEDFTTTTRPATHMCTHYAKLVTEPVSTREQAEDFTTTTRPATQICVQWNCPCVCAQLGEQSTYSHIDHKHCPAHEFPVMPSTLKQEKSTKDSVSGPTAYHTITASEKPAPVVSRSLLESIEKAGPHSAKPLCFKAVVHRIFCKHETQSTRFSLLVEDDYGTFAVIAVPSNHGNEQLWELEGRSVCFSGLLVDSRTTRDKYPSLFSVIDVVWSGVKTMSTSQDSQHSELTSPLQPCTSHRPGFCYNLKSDNDAFSVESTLEVSSCYKKCALSSLKSVSQSCLLTRKSFLAKIIFKYEENTSLSCSQSPRSSSSLQLPGKGRQLLFVTDSSLQNEISTYLTIEINCNLCVDEIIGNGKSALFFRDLVVEDGKCQVDVYSDVTVSGSNRCSVKDESANTLQELQNLDIRLPEISNTCTKHSLVSVTGHVCDVDDEASYSWEVCDQCKSDKLATRPNKQGVFCVTCQKSVSSPESLLKMEVYVHTEQLTHDCKLKIDLLQSTAKSLLPRCHEEEGYDIDCVLLKNIGPLLCFINNVTKRGDLLDIFAQEIKT